MKNHMLVEEERIEAQPEELAQVLEMKPATSVPLNLFSDCLLEANSSQRAQRRWSVLLSLIFQGIMVSILVLLPLMFTDVLPAKQLVNWLVAAPPPPPPPPPEVASVKVANVTSDVLNGQLITPASIPTRIKLVKEDEAPPSVNATGGVPGGVPGGIPGGQMGGVLGGIISATRLPVRMPELSKRVRVSQGVSDGLLLHKVVPEYPPLAHTARIDGTVVLAAVISKNGTIENLRLVSGHPMLAPAAIEAVRQWRYRPYLLDGTPVEIETTINVIFSFQNQ